MLISPVIYPIYHLNPNLPPSHIFGIRCQVHMLRGVVPDVHQASRATVDGPGLTVHFLGSRSQRHGLTEDLHIIRCRQGSIVVINRLHGGAVGIVGPNPSTQGLLAGDQFVGPHQHSLAAQVHGVRTTVLVVEDVLPLGHAVHRVQQWQSLLLQPAIGRLGLFVLQGLGKDYFENGFYKCILS